ncbi:MAG: type ISP restriction/modification enzyme, partial [Dolichospermum sp.]
NYDWINQRNDDFESFISLGDKKDVTTKTIFDVYSRGFETRRDSWSYNFSHQSITDNMSRMIDFYNSQVVRFKDYLKGKTTMKHKELYKGFDEKKQKEYEQYLIDTGRVTRAQIDEYWIKMKDSSFKDGNVIKEAWDRINKNMCALL